MICLDYESKSPLYQQLYDQLKSLIITGEYSVGARIPFMRELARNLNVARNTVERAYQQLSVEGYIESRRGRGFIVMELDFPRKVPDKPKIVPKREVKEDREYEYEFLHGRPDPRTFQHTLWRRLTNEVMHDIDREDLYDYGDNQGEPPLRKEIRDYLFWSRGVVCEPEQIVVGAGIQDIFSIICTLFRDETSTLAIEDPGYDVTRHVFMNNGYKINPIPVGEDGIKLEELMKSGAKLAYVTPSHQLPTGVVMPIQNRFKLLNWANEAGCIVIEDDYDSEFRYNTRPIPSLQSIDTFSRVIYIGTFSKVLAPGLRMSYCILPEWLMPKYHSLFKRYKCPVSRLQQYTTAYYMTQGYWERHLRTICLCNRLKHDTLISLIKDEMADKVRIRGYNAGLHVLLEFTNGEIQEEMVELAAKHGVRVSTTRHFWNNREDSQDNVIIMGFGSMTKQEIIEGFYLLKQAWFG